MEMGTNVPQSKIKKKLRGHPELSTFPLTNKTVVTFGPPPPPPSYEQNQHFSAIIFCYQHLILYMLQTLRLPLDPLPPFMTALFVRENVDNSGRPLSWCEICQIKPVFEII